MQDSNNVNRRLFSRFERTLSAARQGQENELGCLLDFYRAYLLTFATKKLSRQLAIKNSPSDLVQETLMKASSEFRNFRGVTESELITWLKKILARKLIDAHRFYCVSATRDISREIPILRDDFLLNSNTDLEQSEISVEKFKRLSSALSRLDDVQQKVIRLRTFERKSFDEIARELDRSPDAARKIWARAVLRLAKEIRVHES